MACVVHGCKSHNSRKTGVKDTVSFHRFPQDEKLKELWTKAVHRLNWEPSKYSRVCSKHFADNCYRQGKSMRLLCRDAIPTIFEDYPSYLQKESAKLRRDCDRERDRQIRKIVTKRRLQTFQTSVAPELNEPSTSTRTQKRFIPRNQFDTPSYNDALWRNKVRLVINKLTSTSTQRLKKLKIAQQQCRRLRIKVASLENALSEMKSKSLNCEGLPQVSNVVSIDNPAMLTGYIFLK